MLDHRAPARRLMARLDEFARFTDEARPADAALSLQRASRRLRAYIAWCARSGLTAKIDAAGNVCARYEGKRRGAPALMIGSHIDTVRDAGRYDGNLGALAALAVVEELARRASGSITRSRSSPSATISTATSSRSFFLTSSSTTAAASAPPS